MWAVTRDWAEKLSDRIHHFFTINEFRSFTEAGYRGFEIPAAGGSRTVFLAPGLRLLAAEFHQARHHAVLAHGLAVQAIRAKGKQGVKIGPAENIETAVPLIESPEHIKAAQTATREMNAPFLTVMLEGRYTEAYLKDTGKDASQVHRRGPEDHQPLDFVGINVYLPRFYVLATDKAPGWHEVPYAKGHAKAPMSNFAIGPEALYSAPKHVQSLWGGEGDLHHRERLRRRRRARRRWQGLRHRPDHVRPRVSDPVAARDGRWCAGKGLLLLELDGQPGVDRRIRQSLRDCVGRLQDQKRTPKMSASFFRDTTRRNAVA